MDIIDIIVSIQKGDVGDYLEYFEKMDYRNFSESIKYIEGFGKLDMIIQTIHTFPKSFFEKLLLIIQQREFVDFQIYIDTLIKNEYLEYNDVLRLLYYLFAYLHNRKKFPQYIKTILEYHPNAVQDMLAILNYHDHKLYLSNNDEDILLSTLYLDNEFGYILDQGFDQYIDDILHLCISENQTSKLRFILGKYAIDKLNITPYLNTLGFYETLVILHESGINLITDHKISSDNLHAAFKLVHILEKIGIKID